MTTAGELQHGMASLPACMGGRCNFRDRCGRHVATDRENVSERLCSVGNEQPEPINLAAWVAEQMGAQAKPTDADLERLTGEPHIDGWPLYSGLPPSA